MSGSGARRVLVIYLEPAQYVVDYVAKLRTAWPGDIDVFYAHSALTQPWDYDVRRSGDRLLTAGIGKAILELWKLLASGHYGLVNLPGWGHPILLAALVLAVRYGIPVVMETDTPLLRRQPIAKQIIKRAIYPFLFRWPAYFLPGGSRQVAYLRHYGVAPSRIKVMQMTVDVERISAYADGLSFRQKCDLLRAYDLPDDSIRFLFVGRLEPLKGLADLLNAFEQLSGEMAKVRLLIAGNGSQAELVERQASRNKSIRYLGRLSGDRLWEAYALSDALVLPSHFEPWGLVVNEAMAAGLPVIVTEQAGCADDLVVDGKTGLIVPAGAPEQLAEAMRELAAKPALRRLMREEARRHIAGWTPEHSAAVATGAWQAAISAHA